MKYLEVSDNFVLEGQILKLDKFDIKVHHDWAAIIPRHAEKIWKWSIYHTKAAIISRIERPITLTTNEKGDIAGSFLTLGMLRSLVKKSAAKEVVTLVLPSGELYSGTIAVVPTGITCHQDQTTEKVPSNTYLSR